MRKQILIDSIVLLVVVGAFTVFEKIHSAPPQQTATQTPAQTQSAPAAIPNPGLATTTLTINGTSITVELAVTSAEQSQGLSDRTSLGQNAGMLFVFNQPGVWQFWMKDMNFPLDIIWFDANKKIVYIAPDLAPATYPQSFGPSVPSEYVLEVNAGFAASHGLRVGDSAQF